MASDIDLVDGKYILGHKEIVGDPTKKLEDRAFVGKLFRDGDSPLLVSMVADGVGSADIGSAGAELAINTAKNSLEKSHGSNIPLLIKEAIEAANDAVYKDNEIRESNALTTLVVGVIFQDRFYVGNVGDSRAYWVPPSGKMLKLTRDHTYHSLYGGDPNSDTANVLVNSVGPKPKVKVDLGFYLKGDDIEEARSLGMAGLPLHKGEAIVLCTDGLIKKNSKGERYATDEEIVEATQSEYRPNTAAIKMVSIAEGRRPHDNVSAVTIQYLSPEIVTQMQANSQKSHQMKILRRLALGVGITALVVLVVVLGSLLSRTIRQNNILASQTPVMITNTSAPTLTSTQPIDPGKARVEEVNGIGASVEIGQYIDSGTQVESRNSGIRIIVGEQLGNPSVFYLFLNSTAKIVFGEKLAPVLESGTLYIQPGEGIGEVHFKQWEALKATVYGSRMIVEVKGTDVWIYCFEGTCQLFDANNGKTTKPQFMQVYHTDTGQWEDEVQMSYDLMWDWNVKCNYCMNDMIPSPTPSPTPRTVNQDHTTIPSDTPGQNRPSDTLSPTSIPSSTLTPRFTPSNTPIPSKTLSPSITPSPSKTLPPSITPSQTKITPSVTPITPTITPTENHHNSTATAACATFQYQFPGTPCP